MSKPNKFDRLKSLKDQMESVSKGLGKDSSEYKKMKEEYDELMGNMPKYRPHVWRNKGL